MSVKIRLTRMGKKKQPTYRVVVMDSRRPRDGAYIDQIGVYDPRRDPSVIEIDNDKAVDWLRKGAQPTDRARKLLEVSGAWTRFRVAKGDIHTIADPAPAPAPEATGGTDTVDDDGVAAPGSDGVDAGEVDGLATAEDAAAPGPDGAGTATASDEETTA